MKALLLGCLFFSTVSGSVSFAQPMPVQNNVPPVNQPPAQVAQPVVGSAAPLQPQVQSAIEPEIEITLESSMTLRDPFRRSAPKMSTGLAEGGLIPELERYDIEQFKLVGIITGPKKNKALISTPDGKMHVVSESMRLGSRRGLVKRITAGILSVEERVVNLLGQEEKVETKIEFLDNKDKDKGNL